MGIFAKNILIAQLKVGLIGKEKVFVSFLNIPNENNIELQSYVTFLFFFDKVLVNMSEKLSVATLNSIHTWGTNFLNEVQKIYDQEDWEIEKLKLKTPNTWTFTNNEEDFKNADFTSIAEIYSKGQRIFCQTKFSNDAYIEAKTYLLLEALFNYLIQNSSLDEYTYYVLPSLLAQCSFYNEMRPGITQVGQAVYYGLEQAENLREKHTG